MSESRNTGAKGGEGSQTGTDGSAAEAVRQAFAGLPLDEKVSTLIQVELDMLGDAVNTVASAVSRVVDDIARACENAGQPGSQTEAGNPTA
jgi:hypothetical protein